MTADNDLVRLEDVGLTLTAGSGPVNILSGVNFRAGRAATTSIVGPSGSGKTSMLMLMAGLERPSSGRIVIDGTDLSGLDEDGLARFRRGRIGVVFQSFHLVPTMTALENAALPLELAGTPAARTRAAECLELVGLSARLEHYPAQLSGGEQQRVAIARAFAPRPVLLLADEPTGNLDEAGGRVIADLLFSLRESYGATLILVTHDSGLAARCAERRRMRDGRLLPPDQGA